MDKYLYKEVPCPNRFCAQGYVEQSTGQPWECEMVICEVCNGEEVVETVDDNEDKENEIQAI